MPVRVPACVQICKVYVVHVLMHVLACAGNANACMPAQALDSLCVV